MKKYKKVKVVMLPTNSESCIFFNTLIGGPCIIYGSLRNQFNQHLHFITDEKIKLFDWYIVELFKITGESDGLHLERCFSFDESTGLVNSCSVELGRHIDNCKKVIASSDLDLMLPKPKFKFLQEYCIDKPSEVYVEYISESIDNSGEFVDKLKVSKKEQISIQSKKNKWSKFKLINLLFEFNEWKKESPNLGPDEPALIVNWFADKLKVSKFGLISIQPKKTSWDEDELRKIIFEFNKWRKEVLDLGQEEPTLIVNWLDEKCKNYE